MRLLWLALLAVLLASCARQPTEFQIIAQAPTRGTFRAWNIVAENDGTVKATLFADIVSPESDTNNDITFHGDIVPDRTSEGLGTDANDRWLGTAALPWGLVHVEALADDDSSIGIIGDFWPFTDSLYTLGLLSPTLDWATLYVEAIDRASGSDISIGESLHPSVDSTHSLGEDTTPLRWLGVATDAITVGGVGITGIYKEFTADSGANSVASSLVDIMDIEGGTDIDTNVSNDKVLIALEDDITPTTVRTSNLIEKVGAGDIDVTGDLLPVAADAHDLGNATFDWEDLHVDDIFAETLTVNDTGLATADVRMESDTVANLFFLDASANKIGIGQSNPTVTLHLGDGGNIGGSNVDILLDDSPGGGLAGILYNDLAGGSRYGLHFPGSNVVALVSRGANGTVEIRANTATAGTGGEVTAATFADTEVTVHLNLLANGDTQFGDSAADVVTFLADIKSNLLSFDNTQDIGVSGNVWDELWVTDADVAATLNVAGATTLVGTTITGDLAVVDTEWMNYFAGPGAEPDLDSSFTIGANAVMDNDTTSVSRVWWSIPIVEGSIISQLLFKVTCADVSDLNSAGLKFELYRRDDSDATAGSVLIADNDFTAAVTSAGDGVTVRDVWDISDHTVLADTSYALVMRIKYDTADSNGDLTIRSWGVETTRREM